MPSFERAMAIGVDALEMDVHITTDDVVIVAHDDSAARMCGAPIQLETLDHASVLSLDAGWGYLAKDGTRPFAGRGVRIPTFADVLAAFPHMHINVDVKTTRTAEATVALIKAANAEERVTIASFALKTLVGIRRRGYGGPTALSSSEVASLASLPALLWRQLPFTGGAAQVPTKAGPFNFDRAPFIAKAHSIGLRVDFWTIDDFADAARLLELGADGIMTNDPAALKPLFV